MRILRRGTGPCERSLAGQQPAGTHVSRAQLCALCATQLALAPCLAPASRRKANPQAFGNVLRRMLEAAGRGMWNADPQTLEQLQQMYAELDDELEGIKRN